MHNTTKGRLELALVLTGCAFSVFAEVPTMWWSIGPVFRGDMEFSVSGSSLVQQMGIHAARSDYALPSGVGSTSSYADRRYDDGFVGMDPGTVASGDGLTWYWGYARADQYNAAADILTFSRGGGSRVTVQTTQNDLLDESDRTETWGVEFTAGGRIGNHPIVAWGWQAGLGFLWNLDSRAMGTIYAETVAERTFSVVDVYSLDGVVPPAPPYSGTYDGPGPLIPNRPATRSERVTGGSSWRAENDVRIALEAVAQQLWLGPRFEVAAGKGLNVFCVPFVSLNRLEARYERDEWFYAIRNNGSRTLLDSWHNRTTDEQWLLGLGVRAGARLSLNEQWFVDVAAGLESVESAETTLGPNSATLDMSGYSVVAQIGASF